MAMPVRTANPSMNVSRPEAACQRRAGRQPRTGNRQQNADAREGEGVGTRRTRGSQERRTKTAVPARTLFRAGNPDQERQERQEAKNSAAIKEHFPSRAVPRSSAPRQPLSGIQKEPGDGPSPPARAKPENFPEMLGQSRRALRLKQTRGSPQERPGGAPETSVRVKAEETAETLDQSPPGRPPDMLAAAQGADQFGPPLLGFRLGIHRLVEFRQNRRRNFESELLEVADRAGRERCFASVIHGGLSRDLAFCHD